jgi:hypothetical protein
VDTVVVTHLKVLSACGTKFDVPEKSGGRGLCLPRSRRGIVANREHDCGCGDNLGACYDHWRLFRRGRFDRFDSVGCEGSADTRQVQTMAIARSTTAATALSGEWQQQFRKLQHLLCADCKSAWLALKCLQFWQPTERRHCAQKAHWCATAWTSRKIVRLGVIHAGLVSPRR